jgi:protein phosphatase 1 regulatory subunit 42
MCENKLSYVGQSLMHLTKLVRLALADNKIKKIENLGTLVNLQKLFLERNRITRLEGLHNCKKLDELDLSEQDIPITAHFTFEIESLDAIGSTLRSLNLSSSRVADFKMLCKL